MRLVFMGPPGAGKGTQAKRLATAYGLRHISTGDLIRAAIQNETPLGKKAQPYLEAGQLVPDELVWELARAALAERHYDHFVLDGFPRTVQQAEWLDALLRQVGRPLQVVLNLIVPDELIIERLSRRRVHKITGENYHLDFNPPPPDVDPSLIIQRPDDHPAAIRKRLEVYRTTHAPLEQYYRACGLLVDVDGVGSMDEVSARIQAVLKAQGVLTT
ncbi:MAG: adenylate kinase [Rhodothermus sp.]|nr:adenylate kinase [Rhodothermus sp.]